MSQTRYVTTPIYYVNDRPHIGHAYTTIAADVLARWWRSQGDDVFFLTGTDEHGAKVAESAAAAGKTVTEFIAEHRVEFQRSYERLGIRYDKFIATTDPSHERQVVAFLEKLKRNDAIYEGEYRGLYCVGCEDFYTEKELIDGCCPVHGTAPEEIKERNFFFKLSSFLPDVERRIRNGEIQIEPKARRNETLALMKQGIPDFSISREKVTWGIPFPGDPKQTVYVWAEALQNYITALGALEPDRTQFETFWPHALHIIGKDILKFHAVWWPALLLAAGERPPQRIFAHGFFTVDGKKMSKSLGNVLNPNTMVETFGMDGTRYLLLTQFPFGGDGDVQRERFVEKYNADLANGIGNYASRVLAMVQKYSGSEVPTGDAGAAVMKKIGTAKVRFDEAMESLQFDGALKTIRELLAFGDSIVDTKKPWELAKNKNEQLSVVLVELLTLLTFVTYRIVPFMPETAEKIGAALGIDVSHEDKQWPLPPGRALQPLPPLFPRLT